MKRYSVYYTGTNESIKRFDSKRQAFAYAKKLRRVSRSEIGVRDEKARWVKTDGGWERSNPCHLKGRKVKGGRSVTLRNMASVTIIRRQNGTVGIRGVKK